MVAAAMFNILTEKEEMMVRTASIANHSNAEDKYKFIVTNGFVKKLGRGAATNGLTPDNVALVFPTEEEDKPATIGFGLSYNSEPLDGVHMTGAKLTSKDSLAHVQEHADATAYTGAVVVPQGYTFYGPNTVVVLKHQSAERKSRFTQLNAVGTPEGDTDERVPHVSVPVKRDENGNWIKRFEDVSDEKFKFWVGVLNHVPSWEGKSDLEVLALLHADE